MPHILHPDPTSPQIWCWDVSCSPVRLWTLKEWVLISSESLLSGSEWLMPPSPPRDARPRRTHSGSINKCWRLIHSKYSRQCVHADGNWGWRTILLSGFCWKTVPVTQILIWKETHQVIKAQRMKSGVWDHPSSDSFTCLQKMKPSSSSSLVWF